MTYVRLLFAPLGLILGPVVALVWWALLRTVNRGRDGPLQYAPLAFIQVFNARGVWPGMRETVIGKRIYINGPTIDPDTLQHALVHVAQWKRYGPVVFPALYGYELVAHGYTGNRLEIEAGL